MGEFEEAAPEVTELTGQTKNNIEICYEYGQNFKETGVVSEDGLTITTKGM